MHLFALTVAFVAFTAPTQQEAPAWVVQLMDGFQRAGILVGYPDGLSHSNPRSRYEVAVKVYATIHNVDSYLTAAEKEPAKQRATIIALMKQEANWPRLNNAVVELRRELDSMEAKTDELSRLSSGFSGRSKKLWLKINAPDLDFRSFPDVPQDHWAAKAVSELKSDGILSGYPTGRFKGG